MKKLRRHSLIPILWLLCSLTLLSQPMRFHHLTSADGISQSEVYCFLKDSRGFMWFGTVDGLNMFDGYTIRIFNTKKDNPHYLSNNTIRGLAEDPWGRIWIGTDDGLNMYDPSSELICQIPSPHTSLQHFTVNDLLVYDQYLYVGTRDGLFRILLNENSLEDVTQSKLQVVTIPLLPGHSTPVIGHLKKSMNGGFWLHSTSMAVRIMVESMSGEAVIIEKSVINPPSPIVDIVEDKTGNLWICLARNGVIRYRPSDNSKRLFMANGTTTGPSSSKSSSITSDKDGNIWIGTLDRGLNRIASDQLNKDQLQFDFIENDPFNPLGLNSNLIYSLYVSQDNTLWVGTIGSGVNILDPDQKKFTHYKISQSSNLSTNSNFIRAVYANNDEIWLGTHSNGLFLFDKGSGKFEKIGLETQTVFFITPYTDKKILIGCTSGLYLVELINGKLSVLSKEEKFAAIFFITNSLEQYFWFASLNGIARFKIMNDKIVVDKTYSTQSTPAISFNNTRSLFYNKQSNELIAGTEGGGLNILSLNNRQDVVKIRVFTKSETQGSISNNYIRSIIQDSNSDVWIGTYEGLSKMMIDGHTGNITFKTYTQEDGLPNNMIQSIVEDNDQNLWIGTNNGLSKFIPKLEQFINYSESDGIQSKEFSEHTVYKTPDGEIIMGGINGITSFFPQAITNSSKRPQTTVTDFYLFGHRINAKQSVDKNIPLPNGITRTDSIDLLPDQNSIAFDFSSMLYPNSEKIRYAFKLEGFDQDWQYTDASKRNANYTNLKHGNYIFKVKSTNSDAIWEENPREIFIHIRTPFIFTWYAYIMYLLAIFLIFIYFSHFSIIRYTTKNKLLLEQEHNKKIQELERLRTEFFINISHDLRTPLTLIKEPLENILFNNTLNKEVKEKLELIKRNVKRLNYLVEQLLDVRKAESGKLTTLLQPLDIVAFTNDEVAHFTYAIEKKGIKLTVGSTPDKIVTNFDPAMLSKVFFNLISNALKFTDKGEINITIQMANQQDSQLLNDANYDSFVKVEVRDTGKGFSRDLESRVFEPFFQNKSESGKGYGIGLSHTRKLIEAHNGYIFAQSQENSGTTIQFYIPHSNVSTAEEKRPFTSYEDIYINNNSEKKSQQIQPIKRSAKTILIVEDNADMRTYIKSELQKEYHVLEAEDGLEGITMAEDNSIDLIITDVMMPNMDGLEFCKHIKTNLKTSHIPVILLTAKVDTETKYEGIETGADDYIPKPFEMQYLMLRIKNLLHSREQLQKLFQNRGPSLEPSAVTVTTLDERFLSELMTAIEKGIPDSEFNVNTLEVEMGMSHSNFYRKVKCLTGQSGKELLHEMRMKRARQLLLDNDKIRIDEVAYMVGFTNPKYFGRSFKEMFGVTPSEMKQSET